MYATVMLIYQRIMQNTNLYTRIKSNFSPGLVVFLVALPLCLGIALASGAPPLAGIITGIIGGIVVGGLSNSSISVSGPAAGLTAILVAGITELGSFELLLLAGVIAGLIQILFGFIRAGSISNYFPSNVIEGMLAGIGIIIVLKQIPYAFGYQSAGEEADSLMAFLVADPKLFIQHIISQIHVGAVLITALSIVLLLVWEKVGVLRKLKMVPGALVAVIFSIALNALFKAIGSPLYVSESMLVELPVVSNLDELTQLAVFPDFSGLMNSKVWILGATIAMVASIETLLCIEAADKMDPNKHTTDTNRELKAQGLGNLLSSLIGGLPMTSVVVRSSANARAGATSKISAIIHGVLLLVCVLLIPVILNLIPLATLSAVLILVGYKLARPAVFVHFWHKGRLQFIPFIATMLAVVFTDLLTGVGVGLVISIGFILIGNKKKAFDLGETKAPDAEHLYITLAEEVSFLNKAAVKSKLNRIQPDTELVIDASKSTYIASDVLELIEDFANNRARELNIKIQLIGFKTSYEESIENEFASLIVKHDAAI